MRSEAKTVALVSGLGILTSLSAVFIPTRYVAVGGLVLLFSIIYALRKSGKNNKWLLANAIWPYITTWYASWVVVYASLFS